MICHGIILTYLAAGTLEAGGARTRKALVAVGALPAVAARVREAIVVAYRQSSLTDRT